MLLLPVLLNFDRAQLLAAESLGAHHGWTYDLEFDTTHSPDPLDLAQLVLGRLER